jgi:hypothetical protein
MMIAVADTDGDHLVTFSDIVNLWHQVWNTDIADSAHLSYSSRYK